MRVKAPRRSMRYSGGMLGMLIRLLAVASLVLMPFGMLATPVAAAAPHAMTASMSCEGHDKSSQPAPESKAHCTSCVAIAAPHAADPEADIPPVAILADPSVHLLLGLEPDVATPPPKRV